MSVETTIKLRQEDANVVNQDGDWVSTLARPIQIDPGDQIQIKSVFIDTLSSSSQKIVLSEDTEFELSTVSYITLNTLTDKDFNPALPGTKPDGKYYFTAEIHNGGTTTLYNVTVLRFAEVSPTQSSYGGNEISIA